MFTHASPRWEFSVDIFFREGTNRATFDAQLRRIADDLDHWETLVAAIKTLQKPSLEGVFMLNSNQNSSLTKQTLPHKEIWVK